MMTRYVDRVRGRRPAAHGRPGRRDRPGPSRGGGAEPPTGASRPRTGGRPTPEAPAGRPPATSPRRARRLRVRMPRSGLVDPLTPPNPPRACTMSIRHPADLVPLFRRGVVLRSACSACSLRRNAIAVLMAIEIMLNAANINLVAFWRYGTPPPAARAADRRHDGRLRDHDRRGRGRRRASA